MAGPEAERAVEPLPQKRGPLGFPVLAWKLFLLGAALAANRELVRWLFPSAGGLARAALLLLTAAVVVLLLDLPLRAWRRLRARVRDRA